MDKIYTMELHEVIPLAGSEILRVPGGWIYYHTDPIIDGPGTFVPLNLEFQVRELPRTKEQTKDAEKAAYARYLARCIMERK